MEIRPTQHQPYTRSDSKSERSDGKSTPPPSTQSDSFSGPPVGELKKKLSAMETSSEERVSEIKSEIDNATYITPEKISVVIDRLQSYL